jgi:polar amino acid transport system permease protein
VEAFLQSQILSAGEFNLTPYTVTALIFLVLTIPMARFVDWLVARDRRRYLASAR